HLQEQLRLRPDVVDGRDARSRALVLGVRERASVTRCRLDDDIVAALHELARARRRQRDAVLVGLDLPGDSDPQIAPTLAGGTVPEKENEPRERLRVLELAEPRFDR